MARESISKIAYKTLQQSKSIAGFAHKQISSRLMNFILPDSKLENFNIDRDLLMQIQNSMDLLREEDWNDACLLYTSPSPRDRQKSRMPSSA